MISAGQNLLGTTVLTALSSEMTSLGASVSFGDTGVQGILLNGEPVQILDSAPSFPGIEDTAANGLDSAFLADIMAAAPRADRFAPSAQAFLRAAAGGGDPVSATGDDVTPVRVAANISRVDEVFAREQWVKEATTAQGRLLLAARQGVALKFPEGLPVSLGIEGVPEQSRHSPLARWLKGEPFKPRHISVDTFYSQVRALLIGLDVLGSEADRLIREAQEEG